MKWLGENPAATLTKPRSKAEEAEVFLGELLQHGPVVARDGHAAARAAGIAPRTLSKAKQSMHIIVHPAGGPKTRWFLPGDPRIPAVALGNGEDAGLDAAAGEAE